MKGYLTDPYFSLTQMLNFSWQVRILSSEMDGYILFLQEISVGIMSSMIILPPVILMVSLFRK